MKMRKDPLKVLVGKTSLSENICSPTVLINQILLNRYHKGHISFLHQQSFCEFKKG